jgi:methyl-accepting chemotaxis protein
MSDSARIVFENNDPAMIELGSIGAILSEMKQAAGGASVTLQAAEDSCAVLETSSVNASESSEAIRRSIGEIAAQSQSASETISELARNVSAANSNSGELEDAVKKIASVVILIRGIAKQTHLLALNATIEAARVGDVGRGFAVVANEVKALATQTAGATEDIATQVLHIQEASGEAINSIKLIHTGIQDMDSRVRSIAQSVGSQQAAIGGIVLAISNSASSLGGMREALRRIKNGASANFDRATKMEELLGAVAKSEANSRGARSMTDRNRPDDRSA